MCWPIKRMDARLYTKYAARPLTKRMSSRSLPRNLSSSDAMSICRAPLRFVDTFNNYKNKKAYLNLISKF